MIFEWVYKDNCKSMLKLKRGLEVERHKKIPWIIFKEEVRMESSKNETLNVI